MVVNLGKKGFIVDGWLERRSGRVTCENGNGRSGASVAINAMGSKVHAHGRLCVVGNQCEKEKLGPTINSTSLV